MRSRVWRRRCFNTQPPEGGCRSLQERGSPVTGFQHTAARRRLRRRSAGRRRAACFNTQPPEGGCPPVACAWPLSRCFNTQPPEGGCFARQAAQPSLRSFNTQPPEGGCPRKRKDAPRVRVSTHSRPKAAAARAGRRQGVADVSTHSRPKAAARCRACSTWGRSRFQHTAARRRLPKFVVAGDGFGVVSTHSRPKAAARCAAMLENTRVQFQHTAARRRLLKTLHLHFLSAQFQHTAARRRLPRWRCKNAAWDWFQHTAARRRLLRTRLRSKGTLTFQHTAARRRLPPVGVWRELRRVFQHTAARRRLRSAWASFSRRWGFNTQPPEGGCLTTPPDSGFGVRVSTHSRPKAAAMPAVADFPVVAFQHTAARRRLPGMLIWCVTVHAVSTHSRPKAAAQKANRGRGGRNRGFNTQPPEGGCQSEFLIIYWARSFNTQPPEGGCYCRGVKTVDPLWFQHTAARRRLPLAARDVCVVVDVSTHSRPKAAAQRPDVCPRGRVGFNTQPPEGGCYIERERPIAQDVSTHSRPKAAATKRSPCAPKSTSFNTQPPEGGCLPPRLALASARRFNTQPPEGGCLQPPLYHGAPGCVSTHSRPKAAASPSRL